MLKPYDFSDLAEKAKGMGLAITEDAARELAVVLFAWFEESAKLSKTPYDDMALIVLPQLKSIVFTAVDKIDGCVGDCAPAAN